jgi:hypothetical protein
MLEIPDAIINNCRSTWLKVARVVSFAHRELGLQDDEASFDLVASELVKLVEAGRLEAVGDLSDWRHSEVRLATP